MQGLKDTGIPVLDWEDFLFVGQTRPREAVSPTPEDISTIMYTSGTTGGSGLFLLPHQPTDSCQQLLADL